MSLSTYRPRLSKIAEEPSYEDFRRAVTMSDQQIKQTGERLEGITRKINDIKSKFYYTEWYRKNEATRCCFRVCPHWVLLFPLATAILGVMVATHPEIVTKEIGAAFAVSGFVGCASTYYFAWGNMNSLHHIEKLNRDLSVLRNGLQTMSHSVIEDSALNSGLSIASTSMGSNTSEDSFLPELKISTLGRG